MKRAIGSIAAVLLGMFFVALAQADDTKWVRGSVTAMSGNTVTVKANDTDMKFTIDKDTLVVAPEGSTKAAQAMKEGKPGVKVSEILKVGDNVEVHYHDMGGMLHAAEIRARTEEEAAAPDASEKSGMSVQGIITAVAANSITVKSGAQEWTFTVDSNTKVTGAGAGTLTRQKMDKGEKTTLTDFVSVGGIVTVSYHDMGATKHAAEIRVVRKGRAT